MPLVFVTGAPGAGKTAVRRGLTARGFEAYDTDDPNRTGIAGWYDLETNKRVAGFNEVEVTADFLEGHRWQLAPEALDDFSNRSKTDLIFLCGMLRDPTPVIEVSDKLVFLALEAAVIDARLTARAQIPGEVEWGRERWQIERSIERNQILEAEFRQLGAFIIDATRPIDTVVNNVVSITGG